MSVSWLSSGCALVESACGWAGCPAYSCLSTPGCHLLEYPRSADYTRPFGSPAVAPLIAYSTGLWFAGFSWVYLLPPCSRAAAQSLARIGQGAVFIVWKLVKEQSAVAGTAASLCITRLPLW